MRRPRVLGRATLPLLDVLLSPSLAAQASLDVAGVVTSLCGVPVTLVESVSPVTLAAAPGQEPYAKGYGAVLRSLARASPAAGAPPSATHAPSLNIRRRALVTAASTLASPVRRGGCTGCAQRLDGRHAERLSHENAREQSVLAPNTLRATPSR